MTEFVAGAVLGTETEFGITITNQADFNPVLASSLVINSYAGDRARIQWSFEEESPGRDARGFGYQPAPMTDFESGLVNVVLSNGARLYVDHAHPEYATPECTDPLEAALRHHELIHGIAKVLQSHRARFGTRGFSPDDLFDLGRPADHLPDTWLNRPCDTYVHWGHR